MGNRAHARRAAQKLHENRSGESPDSLSMETGANQRSADPAIDVAYRFLRLVPGHEATRAMVNYYFDRLEWNTKCLHRASYLKDLEQLLVLDVETAATTIRPTFLCVHFMVLCLAIHLASGEEVLRWGFDLPTAMQLCDVLFAGSQQLLWASDFIGSHQVEHLQAVILISVYAYNVDEQADAAYALVGASIKIAQNLGLNRLDDARFLERERAKNRITSGGTDAGQESKLEREIGKRVWWYLVWLDWSHALSHGGSYSINPAHNKTNLPTNIDDEDLEDEGILQAKPLEEYTSTSFTIWRLRFLIAYRECIDMINQPGGMTHHQVLEMDKKLINLLNGLPAYFQLGKEDSTSWTFGDSCHDMELLSIQITGQNRILRLHRPFLAKGLMDRNNMSRKRCVEAALMILALFRHARVNAPLLLRVWINIYYVFSGALVLFLDLCYDNDADAESAEEKRRAVREMLEICSEASHLSAAAKNTHNLLQGLLEAETELRVRQEGVNKGAGSSNNNGSKRKRGGSKATAPSTSFSTPFVSLVERVLVDASTKHSGGDSSSTTGSIGKSPSDPTASFEPSLKRHSTSFVRDRAMSQDGRQMRGSPMGGTAPITTSASGAGHGGYYTSNNSNDGSLHYGRTGSSGGSFSLPHQQHQQQQQQHGPLHSPSSPWGPNSSIRTAPWGARPDSANYGSFTASPGGGGYGGGALSSPTVPYKGDATMPMGGSPMTMMGNFRTAATTNGLSSLLDEDIFSGLLMNQPMENSDWESAFAFVVPPPPQQPQYHQQHQQQHQQQQSSGPPPPPPPPGHMQSRPMHTQHQYSDG
jgi:hypothetical protein